MTRALLRIAAVGCAALLLSGCISLLPKSKPAQLYRFGVPAAAAPSAPLHRTVGVFRGNLRFAQESSDDRILTVQDGKAAYIAQSRWVAPAQVLFEQAIDDAFDASNGHVRLFSRGQQGHTEYGLRLEVRTFEARYANPDAAPTVVVRLYAGLSRSDQTPVGEQIFEAQVPAADNRVGAIVAAYDKAVTDVIGKLVDWTNAEAK